MNCYCFCSNNYSLYVTSSGENYSERYKGEKVIDSFNVISVLILGFTLMLILLKYYKGTYSAEAINITTAQTGGW